MCNNKRIIYNNGSEYTLTSRVEMFPIRSSSYPQCKVCMKTKRDIGLSNDTFDGVWAAGELKLQCGT